MRLIGFHGRKGSGKDTAFEILDRYAVARDELAVRKAYADSMKVSLCRALGLDKALQAFDLDEQIGLCNLLKDSGRLTTSWMRPNGTLTSVTITGRQLVQFYGTEAHRELDLGSSFGPDFWVDNLLPKGSVDGKPAFYHNFKESWAGFADYALVTDVRFENEAIRIRELGGQVWKVDAEERLGVNEEAHISEQPLDEDLIDSVVHNNGSLGEFEAEIIEALNADS